MNISVTDPDPRFASALASSLATTVVSFIGAQGTPQQHDLVNRLTAEQKQLYDQRVQLVAALSQATGAVTIANLSPLAAVDQQLNDVGSTLRQLQVAMATGSSASVISLADPAKAVPSGITTELVLVGIAGLIAGLLTASIVEVCGHGWPTPTPSHANSASRCWGRSAPVGRFMAGEDPRRPGPQALRRRPPVRAPAARWSSRGPNHRGAARSCGTAESPDTGCHRRGQSAVLHCSGRRSDSSPPCPEPGDGR